MIRTRVETPETKIISVGDSDLPIIDRRQRSRRSEDYFWLERLSEMSNQAFMVFDATLNLEFANGFTLELFDLDEVTFKDLLCYDDLIEYCIQRGDFGKGVEQTLKALSGDLKANVRLQSRKKSSKLEISTPSGKRLCLKHSYGRDGRMLLVADDITEKYETETALEVALKIGAAGYLSYNVEGKEWNIASKSMIEYFGEARVAQAEEVGLQALIHEDDIERAREIWFNSLHSGETFDMKLRFISKEGNAIWFRAYGVPRFAENNSVSSLFCYYVDITEEMRLQKEQREAVQAAQEALKAKNSFLARLSHEVRTPMNAVVGISDALLIHHNDPTITPKLELIQNSAEKIIRIVDESLTHSKLEEGKVSLSTSPTSPSKCVENVCMLWEQQAAKNDVTLTYHLDKNLPETIEMDGFRYEQCLNNLLSNAVKFSRGGKVQVALKSVQKEGSRDLLVLAVKDNGIGMTTEQQSHIFEAYTQADNSISGRFGGTGLGMTITKQITEMMEGSIKVRSEEGKGTVFMIAIPYGEVRQKKITAQKPTDTKVTALQNDVPPPNSSKQADSIKEPDTASQTSASVDLVGTMLNQANEKYSIYSGLRVLVVDDNETNHMVVSSLLGSLVKSLVSATDGFDAISKLESQEFDIILMDIHMPVMDGIEATLSIRGANKNYSDIPIIALTADPQYQQKRLCLNIGMNDALSKPVRLNEILKAFKSTLKLDDLENRTQKIA
jgi:signal transduction histidine kinase/CheY-like chemotaxis protein